MVKSPSLQKVTLLKNKVQDWSLHPFSVPVIENMTDIIFSKQVCFFVGENGSGKSTLLEAIADHLGFNTEGGSRNTFHSTVDENAARRLSSVLRLSWRQKIFKGYFLRAESFFNIATYVDNLQKENPTDPVWQAYGGKSLHKQSHGEAFLSLFQNQFYNGGFYLLDEPESALSPQRQLSFLVILHDIINRNENTQVIIATHSPILLAFPQAQIISFNGLDLTEIDYEDTQAYQITSGFLANPDLYLRELFV